MLSATDCVNKESASLKNFLSLARARKRIHQTQSRMVAYQEKASSKATDEADRRPATESMLEMAEKLLADVERFLQTAAECGVRVFERRGSEPFTFASEDEANSETHPNGPNRATESSTFPRKSFRSHQKLPLEFTQEALGFLKVRSRSTSNSLIIPSTSTAFHMYSSPLPTNNSPSDYQVVFPSLAPLRSPMSTTSTSSSEYPLSYPSSCASLDTDSLDGYTPALVVISSEAFSIEGITAQVITLHDKVVSSLATFIGYIHLTSRHSFSSSYILEVAQSCLYNITSLLLIVDAVSAHTELKMNRSPEDFKKLAESRIKLFEVVNQLSSLAQASSDEDSTPELLGTATRTVELTRSCRDLIDKCLAPLAHPQDDIKITVNTSNVALVSGPIEEKEEASRETASSRERECTITPSTISSPPLTLSSSISCLVDYTSHGDKLHESQNLSTHSDLDPAFETSSSSTFGQYILPFCYKLRI